ncbi:MAG: histidine kinase [Candidatus Nanopelagicaceae bacterium]
MPELVPPDEETRHERLRIARDLHDTVAQRLAAIGYTLDAAIADEEIPPDRKRSLRGVRLELTEVIKELREEILALRDDQAGSVEIWLKERLAIDFTWREAEENSLLLESRSEIRYLLLELLQNAIKYRSLAEALIEIKVDSVEVNFLAFGSDSQNMEDSKSIHHTPMGLLGVQERIKRLDLRLTERNDGFALQW